MCRLWTGFSAAGLVAFLLCYQPAILAQEQPAASPDAGRAGDVGDLPGRADSPKQDPGGATAVIRPPAATRPSSSSPWPTAVVREPSQARPIFIMPGETFYFVMRMPADLAGEIGFALLHAIEPAIRVPLRPATHPSYAGGEYCSLILEVPPKTEPGLYDLQVRAPDAAYYSRRSVRVVDVFKTKFRFIHLSNMNVGDLTAPAFDEMLPKEINLLAPEFIIATGDYTEWARARDDSKSWTKVLRFFQRFNAPVFMLCGLHDHQASFTDIVASDPMALLDYGRYHGLLLLDHPGNPIDQDYSQLEWIETDLKHNRDKQFNFIAANSDELALLDIWRARGDIETFVKEHKIKMFIVGGSTDWDFREFAQKLQGLDDLHFIRTHQASTALRDRATGFSHYRVIEVDGDQVSYTYPNDTATERLQHSIPTGRLRAFYDAANDGSARRIGVTVQNALNQPFDDVHLWLRVAKGRGSDKPSAKPTVAPGRLIRALDLGKYWACEVAIDLPDKGGVRLVASADPADLPDPRPITIKLEGPDHWTFSPRTTGFGLSYFDSQDPVELKLTNNSTTTQTCWPVVRVNGTQLHPDRSVCPKLPMAIEPGETLTIPLVLNLRRVSPGSHSVQVYFLEDPLCRLETFDVSLGHQQQAEGEVDQSP